MDVMQIPHLSVISISKKTVLNNPIWRGIRLKLTDFSWVMEHSIKNFWNLLEAQGDFAEARCHGSTDIMQVG